MIRRDSSPASSSVSALPSGPEVFLSGQYAPPGVYRNLFSGAEIAQSGHNCLPCRENGSRALYVRLTGVFSSSRRTSITPETSLPAKGS